MNAYIEIESLRSLISQRNDARYDECLRMLKRNLLLNFSFSKSEALADPSIQNWMKELTSGAIAPKPKWDSEYPDPSAELTLDNITIDKLCAVYLLDDEEPQRLASAMLVGYCGHELDTLSQLFVLPETQEYSCKLNATKIKSWKTISSYSAPCTDILISDRYILSKKSLLGRNLYQIINAVVRKTHHLPINIVLLVQGDSIAPNVDLGKVRETIKQNVEEIVGEEPNVTFVLCRQQHLNPLFHDRLILTNYRAITSGDTFNYFNENGNVKTGGFGITIESLAESCCYVQDTVIDTYCKQLKKDIRYAMVQGDKKSNFLTFS